MKHLYPIHVLNPQTGAVLRKNNEKKNTYAF